MLTTTLRCTYLSFKMVFVAALWLLLSDRGAGQTKDVYVELKNGMRLGPGVLNYVETISQNPNEVASQNGPKPIGELDDNLRWTFFNGTARNVLRNQESNAPAPTEIDLPYKDELETSGGELAQLGVLGISQFNVYGRRTYSVALPSGPKHLLQAITRITPTYVKVQTLRVSDSIFWDQRISPWTIPPALLRDILYHQLDSSKPADLRKIFNFYLEGQRYAEAKAELQSALARFPTEFANLKNYLEVCDVLRAEQQFNEVKILQAAGQHQLAAEFLQSFPVGSLPLEVQLRVQDQVAKLKSDVELVQQTIANLRQDCGQLSENEQAALKVVVDEIFREINLESVVRLSDYVRLRGDNTLKLDQKVALAISGWLLGAGEGKDNFNLSKSLIRVRELVGNYLRSPNEAQREQLLGQIKSEEGGMPELVAKLLASLKPPQPLPPRAEKDPPGLYRLTVKAGGMSIDYVVQTPPEYDPNRIYPCLLTLPATRTNPDYQIDFWCGQSLEIRAQESEAAEPAETKAAPVRQRFGHATRYGYIVVSPAWVQPGQGQYNYTEPEKARILLSLRDAMRHFSVDTDRVFISGHVAGATAAWDIALSHPDMWAGAVLISPNADKHIIQYSERNARYIPIYAVYGQWDAGGLREKLGLTVSRYLSGPDYDAIAVCYQGRESGFFPEELPRIIEWMELSSHRRQRAPSKLEVVTSRPGDRFFYWLEAPDYVATNNPINFDPKDRDVIEASLQAASNRIFITNFPNKSRTWIWLSPDTVDFSRPLIVRLKGSQKTFQDLASDVGVMLEDARSRGDRQHPFHLKIEMR